MLRAAPGQHLLPGLPPKLTHLLLLTDLRAASQAAVDCAIELTQLFAARLMLMHGEAQSAYQLSWKGDFRNVLDPEAVRPALVCLVWALHRRGLDVGWCIETGHVPGQVWRTATERQVDLIVLPGSLFNPFRPLASRSGSHEAVEGAPCPLLVVEDPHRFPLMTPQP